jgi:hypothetical protein
MLLRLLPFHDAILLEEPPSQPSQRHQRDDRDDHN